MKLLLPLLLPLLWLSAVKPKEVSPHNIKVEYAMVAKPTAQMDKLPAEIRKTLLEPTHYSLDNNGTESLYYRTKGIEKRDSVKSSDGMNTRITLIRPGTFPVIYKNFENHTILTGTEVAKKSYLTEAGFREHGWKIQQETAEIAGILCRRATMTAERIGGNGGL
ncbi:MAG: hypothetical protein LRY55_06295, partial [Leadbetterella sp.]|nr:hypothetical protein [Leadbetterella sp.]